MICIQLSRRSRWWHPAVVLVYCRHSLSFSRGGSTLGQGGHVPPRLTCCPPDSKAIADRSDVIFEVPTCSKMQIFRGAPDHAEIHPRFTCCPQIQVSSAYLQSRFPGVTVILPAYLRAARPPTAILVHTAKFNYKKHFINVILWMQQTHLVKVTKCALLVTHDNKMILLWYHNYCKHAIVVT